MKTPKQRKRFRCLACGWEGGSRYGINSMHSHFAAGGKVKKCPMVTQAICDRLGIQLPMPKGKTKPVMEFCKDRVMLHMSHSNAHGSSSFMASQIVGTLHPLTILEFRMDIHKSLDEITDLHVQLNVQAVRKLLDQMKHLCDNARTTTCDGLVSAVMIQKIVKSLREGVDLLHKTVHESIEAIISSHLFDLFEKLYGQISNLDSLCLKAIAVPTVSSVGEAGAVNQLLDTQNNQPEVHNVVSESQVQAGHTTIVPMGLTSGWEYSFSGSPHNEPTLHETERPVSKPSYEPGDLFVPDGTAGVSAQQRALLNGSILPMKLTSSWEEVHDYSFSDMIRSPLNEPTDETEGPVSTTQPSSSKPGDLSVADNIAGASAQRGALLSTRGSGELTVEDIEDALASSDEAADLTVPDLKR